MNVKAAFLVICQLNVIENTQTMFSEIKKLNLVHLIQFQSPD